MSLPDFAALNERRAEAGLSTFMNPRNSAAGTIRQLDPALAAERPLSHVVLRDRRHRGARARLALGGARVAARARLPRQRRRRPARQRGRGRRPLPRLAGAPRRARLRDRRRGRQGRRRRAAAAARASSGRDPRWAIAWKFPPTTAVTTLHEVLWNVGKFGDLHPFARLEPVHVGGVTVKMATLHNEEDLARKDVRPGDEVIVLRAGDVIPQVLSPAPHAVERADRAPVPRPPERCPSCDTPTVKPEGAVFTRCPNRDCPDRRWQLLKAFAARDGHRRARREAGRGAPGARARPHGRRLLPADAPSSSPSSTASAQVSAEKLAARDRGLQGAAVRRRAVRGRDRGRRLRHRPQPRGAVPHARRAAGRDAGADRRDARRRPEARRAHPRPARRPADARAARGPARRSACGSSRRARRPARARCASRRSCSPARCPTSRASRRPSGSSPRAARSRARCRARRATSSPAPRRRLQAREGRAARRARDRRGRAARAARRRRVQGEPRMSRPAGRGRLGACRSTPSSGAPRALEARRELVDGITQAFVIAFGVRPEQLQGTSTRSTTSTGRAAACWPIDDHRPSLSGPKTRSGADLGVRLHRAGDVHARRDAELGEDAAHVRLDGLLAEEQLGGDLAAGHPRRDEAGDPSPAVSASAVARAPAAGPVSAAEASTA